MKGEYFDMDILFDDMLTPLRSWINSRVKKVDPLVLYSIWKRCTMPHTVLVSEYAEIEENVLLCQGAEIRGQSKIGKNTKIDKNVVIAGSLIGANNRIHPDTIVAQSVTGDNCELGPHASIELSRIGERSHIGFTAQIKRSILGKRTMAVHHCYIGDTKSGEGVNFSAGSITGNYDGVKKHATIVGDWVMIGTNVNIIAPRRIGNGAFLGAGSIIKEDVEPHVLTLPIVNQHVSLSTLSLHTDRGYELLKVGEIPMRAARRIFGDNLEQALLAKHPLTGGTPLIELLREGQKNREKLSDFSRQLTLIENTRSA